jgi:hypothetical protein
LRWRWCCRTERGKECETEEQGCGCGRAGDHPSRQIFGSGPQQIAKDAQRTIQPLGSRVGLANAGAEQRPETTEEEKTAGLSKYENRGSQNTRDRGLALCPQGSDGRRDVGEDFAEGNVQPKRPASQKGEACFRLSCRGRHESSPRGKGMLRSNARVARCTAAGERARRRNSRSRSYLKEVKER